MSKANIKIKRLLISILIGVILTVTLFSAGIFFIGADIFLLPLIVIMYFVGLAGIVSIPLGLYQLLRKQPVNKWLILFAGLAIGFYLGLIFQKPIDNWDKNQRNISGEILTTEIQKFKEENGHYPSSLNQLNIEDINKSLPKTYQAERFTYFVRNGDYILDIPIPVFDRWHWNKDKNEFEYEDF
jgi:hypothetical protein